MKENIARAIAVEAARILADQGDTDISSARRKAARRLGIGNRRQWPDEALMQEVLREYQALFLSHRQPDRLRYLREQSLELMQLLTDFQPHLTGAVLEGFADIHSTIELHLFSDRAEDLLLLLLELGLSPRRAERSYRYPDGIEEQRPLFVLERDDLVAELSCFPLAELRNRSPLSPLGKGPARRLPLRTLAAGLEGN